MPNGIHPPGSGRPGGRPGPGGGRPLGGGMPGPGSRPPGGGPPESRPPGHFPRFFFSPYYSGFPRNRCDWYDRYGRCCDRSGWCCDRFGRCEYVGGRRDEGYSTASIVRPMGGWYGIPGVWDMMPGMDDTGDT